MVESISIRVSFYSWESQPHRGDIMVENEMYKKDRYSAVGTAFSEILSLFKNQHSDILQMFHHHIE
jgi:hypothetical protein